MDIYQTPKSDLLLAKVSQHPAECPACKTRVSYWDFAKPGKRISNKHCSRCNTPLWLRYSAQALLLKHLIGFALAFASLILSVILVSLADMRSSYSWITLVFLVPTVFTLSAIVINFAEFYLFSNSINFETEKY